VGWGYNESPATEKSHSFSVCGKLFLGPAHPDPKAKGSGAAGDMTLRVAKLLVTLSADQPRWKGSAMYQCGEPIVFSALGPSVRKIDLYQNLVV
jgi:hypothetical protein